MNTKNFNALDNFIARYRLNKIVNFISDHDVVLDFGCGHQGYLLNYIQGKIKKGFGLDPETGNKQEKNLVFKKYIFNSTSKLPFKNKEIDKIVMLAVLEHIEINEVVYLFKEFKRILKKDGLIVLTTPTPLSKPILEFMSLIRIISREEIMDHKKYYWKKDIQIIADKTGLKLVSYSFFQLGLNSIATLETR